MRIEKVTHLIFEAFAFLFTKWLYFQVSIVDASKEQGFVFGPIVGTKSAVLIGDESKNHWLSGMC